MKDQSEINLHRDQLAKNRELIEELEAGNQAGGSVFPETDGEISRLRVQTEQSELIVLRMRKSIRKVNCGSLEAVVIAGCDSRKPLNSLLASSAAKLNG